MELDQLTRFLSLTVDWGYVQRMMTQAFLTRRMQHQDITIPVRKKSITVRSSMGTKYRVVPPNLDEPGCTARNRGVPHGAAAGDG